MNPDMLPDGTYVKLFWKLAMVDPMAQIDHGVICKGGTKVMCYNNPRLEYNMDYHDCVFYYEIITKEEFDFELALRAVRGKKEFTP